jgi:tRNA pseudouridine55 synthase
VTAARPKRFDREVHGILLLDKRGGVSSNRALQEVRVLYRALSGGHTGSLDPLATGLLPLCFGEATKFAGHLLDADKRYQVVAQLGSRTDTGDRDGTVTETKAVPSFDDAALERALGTLRGAIEQVPPMHSALKRDGVPLYKLARRGEVVERAPRRVTIHGFTLVSRDGDRLRLDVHCSKGTYVRTLVEDLAAALGTVGHVAELRRSTVGPFGPAGLATLEELTALFEESAAKSPGDFAALDAKLLPMDAGLGGWPEVRLGPDAAGFIGHGNPVQVGKGPMGTVRIYGPRGFLGLGERDQAGVLTPKRLIRNDFFLVATPGRP